MGNSTIKSDTHIFTPTRWILLTFRHLYYHTNTYYSKARKKIFCFTIKNVLYIIKKRESTTQRGVSEWLMVRSWKGRVGATLPWVRIPSPLNYNSRLGVFYWDEDENPLFCGFGGFPVFFWVVCSEDISLFWGTKYRKV